jgi:pyruvate formate lyase activating enzyme
MQADFVAALFHRLQRTGIHTTIDTSGYSSLSALEKVLPEVDLFLFDVKLMNRQEHKKFTGKYNDVILRNARLIVEKGVPMIIRVPLIHGINDSRENLDETARFISELDNALHVDLLPYHRYGIGKYEMLDMDYQLSDTEYLNEEQLQRAMEVFERYGLDCEIQ